MNRQHVMDVRTRIAEVDAVHCNMDKWLVGWEMPGRGEPPCGTTACIAGHAAAVKNGWVRNQDSCMGEAARFFGLTYAEAGLLFYKNRWPGRYWRLAFAEGDQKGMLAILDALLDGTLAIGGSVDGPEWVENVEHE